MKTQEELFDQIKTLAFKIDDLKGFVQNDFQRMIDDGYLTSRKLMDSIDHAEILFDEALSLMVKVAREMKE